MTDMPCRDRLYLITRSDLPPGARAAQLCHALREFVAVYPDHDRRWFETSNTLVLLEAENASELLVLRDRANDRDIPVVVFREPDLDNAITALAIGPSGRRLVRDLPLALSGPPGAEAQR